MSACTVTLSNANERLRYALKRNGFRVQPPENEDPNADVVLSGRIGLATIKVVSPNPEVHALVEKLMTFDYEPDGAGQVVLSDHRKRPLVRENVLTYQRTREYVLAYHGPSLPPRDGWLGAIWYRIAVHEDVAISPNWQEWPNLDWLTVRYEQLPEFTERMAREVTGILAEMGRR